MTVDELARLQREATVRSHGESVAAVVEKLSQHTPRHMIGLEFDVDRPGCTVVRVRGEQALSIETTVRLEDAPPGE